MKIFEYRMQILEHHLDTFGHVNNATYLEIYEQARWDFITKRGFGVEEIQKKRLGPVVLELNLKFKKELKNREWILIKSYTKDRSHPLVGELHQDIINEKSGKIASSLDLKVGLMDLKERKLVRASKDWLYAIGLSDDPQEAL